MIKSVCDTLSNDPYVYVLQNELEQIRSYGIGQNKLYGHMYAPIDGDYTEIQLFDGQKMEEANLWIYGNFVPTPPFTV